jgi:putative ABC transport system permease protein
MKTLRWAVRALLRSPLRAALLIGVLSVSIGLALIMITVDGAFDERLDEIQSQVGTTVTVQPAGSFGGGFIFRGGFGGAAGGAGGGGGPGGAGGPNAPNATDDADTDADAVQATLTDDAVEAIASIEHVTGYTRTITEQYTGDDLIGGTIEPPANSPFAGNRPAGGFQIPVIVTGTDNPTALASLGVENVEITSGRTFEPDEGEANVAVIGSSLAETNGLVVGDTFAVNEVDVEVVGIFVTGTQFGDNAMFLPLDTARVLFDREGEVDAIRVQVDTAENVNSTAEEIRVTLGEDVADVTTQEAAFDAISAPLADAADSSRVGMIAALIASAAIILFSVAIVARQRVREIGILKALGASNWNVVGQMTLETVFIAVIAAFIGALATFPLAQTVADGLVSDPTIQVGGGGFGRPGADVTVVAGGGPAGNLLGEIDVAVSPEVFGYALVIALGLALVATVIPAWYVGRVKPAEVLRYE